MSRARRILYMLQKDTESPVLSSSISQDSPEKTNEGVNAVALIEEYGTLSPLPPGAQEISDQMDEIIIWNEVLHDKDDSNGVLQDGTDSNKVLLEENGSKNVFQDENGSKKVLHEEDGSNGVLHDKGGSHEVLHDEDGINEVHASSMPEIISVEGVNSNQPTPFMLEVPSSYENSPLIQLEELEGFALNRTTPVDSELSIPTPVPSPSNSHSNCDSEFCPFHDNGQPVIPSKTPTSTPKTKTTRKRKRQENEWIDVKRKCLTNLGKKYITKKGKAKEEKTIKPPCKCRYKCFMKISQEQRLNCFTNFWQLGDREKQWGFIIKYTDKIKKKRCLNQETPNKRKYTYMHYLPLINGANDTRCKTVKVCQTMFINTLAVTTRILKTAWKKFDGSVDIEEDRRGRHNKHKIVVTEAMKQSVCDHVRDFRPVESHYIRKDSTKLYLQGDLSIAKMFKLYLDWFDIEKYTSKAVTERQYRDIVNSNFNIGFHIPKKDQCDECHVFRHKKHPTDEEKRDFQQHQTNKNVARNLKSQDKRDAIDSNGELLTAVFDFEKVLQCPHGNINIFYYKRKLACFNFTIFDMGKKKAVCYMWDESVAKRGANEVSSCLLDFVQANVEQGVKEFRFWSDNCAGQNRNRFVFSCYVYAAQKFNISITHRFLQKGHTQNEGDSVHSLIERASHTKAIYTPDEWRLLVRWAKSEGETYTVRNVTQKDIFDFKSNVNNKVWLKDIKGKKITWNSIKEVHANGSDVNKLFFKYDLTQTDYNILVIRSNTRHTVQTNLKPAYSGPLQLPAAKYKDLTDMCRSNVIPSEYHSFFTSLPHHIIVNDSDDTEDSLSD